MGGEGGLEYLKKPFSLIPKVSEAKSECFHTFKCRDRRKCQKRKEGSELSQPVDGSRAWSLA